MLEKNIFTINPNAKTALVLGLGGGVISNILAKKNIAVTAVELDARVVEVAKKYFYTSDKVNIIEDDARHALFQLKNKYDLVVIDLFAGEITPSHVLSAESFSKIKISNIFAQNPINPTNFFLPYGALLFALWGTGIIPEIEEMLGAQNLKKNLKKIIAVSTIIISIFYLLFV